MDGQIHCCLLLGKSRIAPMKMTSIPRLGLTAATIAVKVGKMPKKELPRVDYECYWTDSSVVLGYISNDSKRFHIFVANRTHHIQEHTTLSQWKYVPSDSNPANNASRGISMKNIIRSNRWFNRPKFLWDDKKAWPADQSFMPAVNDPELRRKVSLA